ncbi:unnamed protein product [Alopecurus aequalis]
MATTRPSRGGARPRMAVGLGHEGARAGNRLPNKTLAHLSATARHNPTQQPPKSPSPMDTSDGGAAAGLDEADAAFFSRSRHRCCCFSAPWQSSSSYGRRAAGGGADGEWWHQVGEGGGGAGARGAERPRWWRRGVDAFMKVREWSELVAGPRWKTFIRRFRRGHHLRHSGGGSGSGGRKLNYDALSYALNFDEGHGASCSPEDGGGGDYPDFTARFAGSARSSMDLGGRDAPSLLHHPLPQQPRTPPALAPAAARG